MWAAGAIEVAVVGAGPSGSLTALLLARAGCRVVLVEAGPRGRDKPCGEGLLPAGVAVLERAGLADRVAGAPPLRAVAVELAGRRAEALLDRPGRGVRRARLDEALAAAAEQAGAAVRFGVRATALERAGRAGWRLQLAPAGRPAEALQAQLLVLADGGRGALGRSGRGPGARVRRVGLVGHLDAGWLPALARDRVQAHLRLGWQLVLTPVEGGQVALAGLRDVAAGPGARRCPPEGEAGAARGGEGAAARWLAARLGDLELVQGASAALPLLAARMTGARTVALVGGAAGALAAAEPGLVRVGDAAGAVDPIVGCGMTLALRSAERAAAAIVAALGGRGDRGLADYQRLQLGLRRPPSAVAALALAGTRWPRAARVVLGSVPGADAGTRPTDRLLAALLDYATRG